MSGLIPQHFIDDLIARADIAEVVGRRVQLRKAGREFKACCPFHDEKTPSFTVSPEKGFYHCFGCGAHGTALGFLMEYEHLSFVEAVESLASLMGIEVPRDESQRPARRYDDLFTLMGEIEQFYRSQLRNEPRAIEYLKQRKIDSATAKRFRLGYAPPGWEAVTRKFGGSGKRDDQLLAVGQVIRKDNGRQYDRFRDRLMFPIRDARGRCIGFGGRVMGDEQPKYLNTSDTVLFHKRQELYGIYEARQALRNIERLVVVEGYMDVVALACNGIDYAVATLGTATTEEHLTRLFRLTDEVTFCFDGDRAGRDAAWKALETALPHLREGRQIRFAFLPEGEDPDSFVQSHSAPAFEKLVHNAPLLSDFLVEELAAGVDMDSVDGRARLAEQAKPLVARVPNGVYKELLIDKLAESIGLSRTRLEQQLSGDRRHDEHRPATKAPARRQVQPNRPSAVRRAISLLLHQPSAATDLDVELLAGVNRPGADLLRDLIETVQAEPNITTAGLLERWRNDEQGRHLGKLATSEVPELDEFDVAAELAAALHQLAQGAARDRIQFLIEKERLGSLSPEEKEELRRIGNSSQSGG